MHISRAGYEGRKSQEGYKSHKEKRSKIEEKVLK